MRAATVAEVQRAAHSLAMAPAALDCPTCGLHDEDVLCQLAPEAFRHERRRIGHRVQIQRLARWA